MINLNIKPIFDWTNHKKLWNWLAENPTKTKYDWIGWKHNGGYIYIDTIDSECFACDYANSVCKFCPLKVSNNSFFTCLDGLYEDWGISGSYNEVSEIALKIAKLSVKEGVLTK